MTELEKIIDALSKRIEQLDAENKQWATGFMQTPAYALFWADDVFDRVAEHKVKGIVLAWARAIENDTTGPASRDPVGYLRSQVEKFALQQVRAMVTSSSVSANHLQHCEAVRWAKLADWLGRPKL